MNLIYLRELFFEAFKNINKETETDIADRYLNIAYLEVYRAHRWEYRKRTANITLIPNYVTGTASVTKWDGTANLEGNAKTVSMTGSTITDSMIGRYFKLNLSSYWHKIIYRSSNTLYLDTPIIDVATGAGLAFTIWKRFYYSNPDVDILLDFDIFGSGHLDFKSDSNLIDEVSDISSTGTPIVFSPYGIDPYDDTEYTTGTVSSNADTNILTGNGTLWLSSGIQTGHIIIINNIEYVIKRIETDIRMVLFNSISTAIPTGTEYRVLKNNPLGFQFYNATDAYRIMNYSYLSKGYPVIHPIRDRMLLPREFIPAIISRAVYYRMRDVNDARFMQMLNIYNNELEGLKDKVNVVFPRYSQFAPKIKTFMPGRG